MYMWLDTYIDIDIFNHKNIPHNHPIGPTSKLPYKNNYYTQKSKKISI